MEAATKAVKRLQFLRGAIHETRASARLSLVELGDERPQRTLSNGDGLRAVTTKKPERTAARFHELATTTPSVFSVE